MKVPPAEATLPHALSPHVAPVLSAPAAPASPDPGHGFADVLRRLGGEIDRGERTLSSAARGGPSTTDMPTLLALQAGVYRYSEAIDLTSRLVDRAASAVKTVLQSQ